MLELFELTRWKDELVESFSHGMKQRLVMCAAFLHRPQAVLVDEPMVGLDPRGARLIKDVFRAMSRRGVAILMSTHTLEVAQEMCDRIAIILKGRIIARGTVDELLALAGGEDEQLTPVFLKLTGGTALQEIDEVLTRPAPSRTCCCPSSGRRATAPAAASPATTPAPRLFGGIAVAGGGRRSSRSSSGSPGSSSPTRSSATT